MSITKNLLLSSYSSMKNEIFEIQTSGLLTPPHYTNLQNSMISFDYSWFLAKNLSNFVSLSWKLHNRYCHNLHLYKYCTWAATLIALPALSGAYLISFMTHSMYVITLKYDVRTLFAFKWMQMYSPLVQVQIKICNSCFRLCNIMLKSVLKEHQTFNKMPIAFVTKSYK